LIISEETRTQPILDQAGEHDNISEDSDKNHSSLESPPSTSDDDLHEDLHEAFEESGWENELTGSPLHSTDAEATNEIRHDDLGADENHNALVGVANGCQGTESLWTTRYHIHHSCSNDIRCAEFACN
jgi:hypothetical protein